MNIDRYKPLTFILVVGLVGVGVFLFIALTMPGRVKQEATTTMTETKVTAQVTRPPMDVDQPEITETATFAMG
jgi:ABC-type transporter Mla subunit MlaD